MADAEQLIVAWLTQRFPDPVRVCTETPGDLETIGRTVKVARAGGSKRLTLDRPRMVLDCWAKATATLSARQATRAWALEVAHAVEIDILHQQLGTGAWCTAASVTPPVWVPDANTTLRHFVVTASLSLRTST